MPQLREPTLVSLAKNGWLRPLPATGRRQHTILRCQREFRAADSTAIELGLSKRDRMRGQRWTPARRFLEHSSSIEVRFPEVDSLGIVWHGHYLTYFELGRNALGKECGLHYLDFASAGVRAPVVHCEVDYLAPARFGDPLELITRFHPEPSAKLIYTYQLRSDGRDLARGLTAQVFTDAEGALELNPPSPLESFLQTWDPGARSDPEGGIQTNE